MKQYFEPTHGTMLNYSIGFSLSILLTMIAYLSVDRHWFIGQSLIYFIVGLGVVQLFVQLIFFLHLGRESKPRWNLMVLLFAALVVLIVVIGSLWIMNNLNYHQMSPEGTDKYLLQEEGIRK